MKPFQHARSSVHKWGGSREDYQPIHDFIDGTKMCMPDVRHRALLHNAWGCYLVERVFGLTLTNSDGREVSTRDVAERHIGEDMGFIPSVEDWLADLPQAAWHGGIHRLPANSDKLGKSLGGDSNGTQDVPGSEEGVQRGTQDGCGGGAGGTPGADS